MSHRAVEMPTSRWRAGLLLALLSAAAPAGAQQVRYYHLDGIGSVRAISNAGGTVTERHDYLPYGEECTTGTCGLNPGVGAGGPRKFTAKERDVETGLDYFGARYQGAGLARFTSIDPVTTWKDNLADPLRWNRYAYSRNNPLRYVDPDGRKIVPSGSPEFRTAVDNARVMMSFSTTVWAELDARPEVITIVETRGMSDNDIRFRPGSSTIDWNPRAGMQVDDGAGVSPATMLAHEIDHALRSLTHPTEFNRESRPDNSNPYGNAEDERVITKGAEATMVQRRGESARKSHAGNLVEVPDVGVAGGPLRKQ
jgi:RHS repeat-associated protein